MIPVCRDRKREVGVLDIPELEGVHPEGAVDTGRVAEEASQRSLEDLESILGIRDF
jgi:hypothetical protein